MSLMSWIRKLLRMKPSVAEQVRMLTAQRVQLEQQRRELDQRLDALEKEERETVERGSAAQTDVERRQLAGKLMRTRRQLRRVQAQANVFTQQIDVLGTHIHHLTLAQQGKQVTLPSAEDLTQEAAEAEQIMSGLAVSADLAAGIEVGATSPAMAEEEQAILDEFMQAAGAEPSAPQKASEASPETPQAAPPERHREPPQREADDSGDKGESARPEMG